MSKHYKVLCTYCDVVLRQCRCPSIAKTITHEICKSCEEKGRTESISRTDMDAAQELTEKLKNEPPGRIRIVGKTLNEKRVLTGANCHVYVMNADGTETPLMVKSAIIHIQARKVATATLEVLLGELDLEGVEVVGSYETVKVSVENKRWDEELTESLMRSAEDKDSLS